MPQKVVKKVVKKRNPKKAMKKRVMKGGANNTPQAPTPQEPTSSRWSNTLKSAGSSLWSGMRKAGTSAYQGLGSAYKATRNAATSVALATDQSAHQALASRRGYVKRNNVEFNSTNNLNKNINLNNNSKKNLVKSGLKAYVSQIGVKLNDSKKTYSEIDTLLKKYATQETTFKSDSSQIKSLVKKIKSLTNKRYEDDYKTEVKQIVLKLKNDFKDMLATLKLIYDNFTKLIDSIYGTEPSSKELLEQLKNARTYVKQLLVDKTTMGNDFFESLKTTKNGTTNYNYNKISNTSKNTSSNLNKLTKLNNSTGNSSSGSLLNRLGFRSSLFSRKSAPNASVNETKVLKRTNSQSFINNGRTSISGNGGKPNSGNSVRTSNLGNGVRTSISGNSGTLNSGIGRKPNSDNVETLNLGNRRNSTSSNLNNGNMGIVNLHRNK